MRLTVLGGSAAGGNPGAGCSGYLVDSGATRIVLDLGPGTLPQLRRHVDYRTLDGIVISHMHLDHILDLAALRFALAYNPIPAPRKVPLWVPPGGIGTLDKIGAAFTDEGDGRDFFTERFEVREYNPTETVTIGDLSLSFAPTVHYIPCWAMRVRTPSRRDLGYTGDTGPAAPLLDLFSGISVLISEGTLLTERNEPFASRGHLTAAEAGALATDAGAGTLVLSHLWHEIGNERLRQQAVSRFGGRLELGAPGLTVEW